MLPMTGTVKARGGVHELLMRIETLATDAGIIQPDGSYMALLGPAAKALFARQKIIVASTGNLGFSIGLVARRFGLATEVHMSRDAKAWKKQRLVDTGATVIEHDCDYEQAVARARHATGDGGYFIDDERSPHLFQGYATAAAELAAQLESCGIVVDGERPLVVFLPCGVGGAPGGITAGLRAAFGDALVAVFVEPVASACFFMAMAENGGQAVSVYEFGLDNGTIADGLAVPRASELVLRLAGDDIDAVMALPDAMMRTWVRRAWQDESLKLEPAAAAALAAADVFPEMVERLNGGPTRIDWQAATRVAWTTGGALMPNEVFLELLETGEGSI
jgi:D-serine dehydratase